MGEGEGESLKIPGADKCQDINSCSQSTPQTREKLTVFANPC